MTDRFPDGNRRSRGSSPSNWPGGAVDLEQVEHPMAGPNARPLRALVAANSFKGSLSATQACRHLSAGLRSADHRTHVVQRPLADGGEGTLDALATAGVTLHQAKVTGPLGGGVVAR